MRAHTEITNETKKKQHTNTQTRQTSVRSWVGFIDKESEFAAPCTVYWLNVILGELTDGKLSLDVFDESITVTQTREDPAAREKENTRLQQKK